MTEYEQKNLNPFGEALVALMEEKGISGVAELVERMRQYRSFSEEMDEDYVGKFMTAVYIDHWPDEEDGRFFLVLGRALELPEEEGIRLIKVAMDSVRLPIDRPLEERRAIFARARELDWPLLWEKLREKETLGRARWILSQHGESDDDVVALMRARRARAQEGPDKEDSTVG